VRNACPRKCVTEPRGLTGDDQRLRFSRRNVRHGGLTPAALVNVRLCIGKIVIMPADGRCNSTKSGGRKPPRGFAGAAAPALVSKVPAVSRDFTAAFLQVRFPNTTAG
jgi:hypothetical protein